MKQKNGTTRSDAREPVSPSPRRRFRLERLEERLAPKKKGGQGGAPLSDSTATSPVSY
jgi:hypothetical protein